MKVRTFGLGPCGACGFIFLYAVVFATVAPSTVRAAGVVGTGTAASCTDVALDAALADGGLVTFNCGGPATITVTSGKDISSDTSIDGGSLITIDGGGSVSMFSVDQAVNFTVQNLTLANAKGAISIAGPNLDNDQGGTLTVTNSIFSGNSSRNSAAGGAAISNHGTLTVTNSTFSGNSASPYEGGAISNDGVLTVTNSTFSGNSTAASGFSLGGAISNGNGGALTVTNSIFSGNSALTGGAISNYGVLTVTNSTFSGNNTDSQGGAIYSIGRLTVTSSTFTGNGSDTGGAISNGGVLTVTNSTFSSNSGGAVECHHLGVTETTLTNTIVTGSTQGANCNGAIIDGGHNLDDGTSCGFSTANGSLSNSDPQLDPAGLKNNGGPTQTVALCTAVGVPVGCFAASPATDAGDQAVCDEAPVNNRDQRGFVRPGSGHTNCSIGAYEADASAPEACTGDCDGNGIVAVNELVLGVNIVLGPQSVDACPAFENADGMVDVAQLIKGVNNALHGCAGRDPSRDLYVAASGTLDGDGKPSNPYRRITDAVARARTDRATGAASAEEEIRIHVAPGTYVGSFDPTQLQNNPVYEVLPIILNVPGLAVLGSTVLVRDDRGLPTGAAPESETILEPDEPLVPSQSLFLVTRTADDAVGNRVTVEGFVVDGRMTVVEDYAAGVFVDRVSDFRIGNNLIRRNSFGVNTRLASGTIEGNLLTDQVEAGANVSGGSIARPAVVLVHANRVTRNALHGLMALADAPGKPLDLGGNTFGLEPLQTRFDRNDPEDLQNIPDTLVVTLSDNDIRDNGFLGIRLYGHVGYGYQTTDAAQPLTAVLTANLLGNTITSNGTYGVAMEAGFPLRNDPRRIVLIFAGSFEGNSFGGNGRAAALFDFTRWNVTLGLSTPAEPVPPSPQDYKFAQESTYEVTDADGELAGFDYDHPVMDPVSGTVLNNTFTLNATEVPFGTSITPE